eukprot:SAG31_NODE_198_length_20656_cov_5.167291_13_plen_158_part_00
MLAATGAPIRFVNQSDPGQADDMCFSASESQTGIDPLKTDEIDLLPLHVTAIVDFFFGLTLLLFHFWFTKQTAANIEDQDGDMISMADYSIQIVPGTIPQDTEENELRSWVEARFGPVHCIEMAYDNDEAIKLYKTKGDLQDKFDMTKEELVRIEVC